MSTSKRRRLNTEESPQPMSAFALRKKLLAKQSQVESPSFDEASISGASISGTSISANFKEVATSPEKKARKTRTTRHTSVERKEVLHRTSELLPNQDLPELLGPSQSQADGTPRSLSPISPEKEESHDINSLAQPVNLSSFRPSKSNFSKTINGACRLKLDEGERLVILGSYGVRVESGEVTIYGATLKASKSISWVHAPQSHALPVIRCTEEATLEFQPHPDAEGLRSLGMLSPLFRKILWENPSSPSHEKNFSPGETFRILYTSEDGPKRAILQDLRSLPEWNREIAAFVALNDHVPSIMVTGPKSSGKSTFGKILTNRLLTGTSAHAKRPNNGGVVILDLDPGQPEYCGAGHIALVLVTKPVLSPSFCRPLDTPGIRTIRSHALASLSPASDPELYTEMAMDLITHYRNAFASYPLVINTPGWIQGTGLDLLVSLIDELRPSEVIYMSQTGPADAVEALGGACNTDRFSTLPSQPNPNNLRTAIHLRSMQTMAYFHVEPTTQNSGDHLCWFQRPLTTMVPWQVRFRGANRGIFGVLCYDFQTQPDLLADAINGTVLAAVELESTKAFRGIENYQPLPNNSLDEAGSGSPMDLDTTEGSHVELPPFSFFHQKITTLTEEGLPFVDTSLGLTLDPRYSRSLGSVLIRGIDLENGYLHLLCPITTTQVEDVKTRGGQVILVSGKFDPPSWAYTEDLYFQSEGDEVDENEGAELHGRSEGVEIDSEEMKGDTTTPSDSGAGSVPWIEAVTRNQKRGAGSKVWRVRRDLGRVGNLTG
ncbi:hypothetical protein F5Y12DRAFT_800932 [Xylaria sp. FL1777]|nr:hypothetical protein F5Y12DRAFT_800932 [Xylaria sp. FL1777]